MIFPDSQDNAAKIKNRGLFNVAVDEMMFLLLLCECICLVFSRLFSLALVHAHVVLVSVLLLPQLLVTFVHVACSPPWCCGCCFAIVLLMVSHHVVVVEPTCNHQSCWCYCYSCCDLMVTSTRQVIRWVVAWLRLGRLTEPLFLSPRSFLRMAALAV